MAVYEQVYKPYTGQQTSTWSRFLIIPRHAYQDIFRSKLFLGFFVTCFVFPLISLILIYLHHNENALDILDLRVSKLIPIDARFFYNYVFVQGMMGFLLTVFIGPELIARDLTNNALPLYLCRPFTRAEYVIGKLAVLLILLSAISWLPGLLLFSWQSYLGGSSWIAENSHLAGAIFFGSGIWILTLAMMSQAISAWVRWKIAAKAALVGLFFIPSVMAEVINLNFETRWGNLISLRALIRTVWAGLFHFPHRMELPYTSAWLGLFVICIISLLLLTRKVRAYEVVR
ncbi:MAG: ABC transporter permease subunit [Acidobacteriota bacterium]